MMQANCPSTRLSGRDARLVVAMVLAIMLRCIGAECACVEKTRATLSSHGMRWSRDDELFVVVEHVC